MGIDSEEFIDQNQNMQIMMHSIMIKISVISESSELKGPTLPWNWCQYCDEEKNVAIIIQQTFHIKTG